MRLRWQQGCWGAAHHRRSTATAVWRVGECCVGYRTTSMTMSLVCRGAWCGSSRAGMCGECGLLRDSAQRSVHPTAPCHTCPRDLYVIFIVYTRSVIIRFQSEYEIISHTHNTLYGETVNSKQRAHNAQAPPSAETASELRAVRRIRLFNSRDAEPCAAPSRGCAGIGIQKRKKTRETRESTFTGVRQ